MSALLQEIVTVYPLLAPSGLTAHASNRVCNALALLQCVASHPETRGLFLNGMSLQWAARNLLVVTASATAKAKPTYAIFISLSHFFSPHSSVLVPVLEHHQQDETFRVFALD